MSPSSPSSVSLRPARAASASDIHCPQCHKLIFDGEVLLARVTRFGPDGAQACCKICKTWVPVPVCPVSRADIGWGRFALGTYTEQLVKEGCRLDALPLMQQAFLNLLAAEYGLSSPSLAHVLAGKASVAPRFLAESRARWPSLLPPET